MLVKTARTMKIILCQGRLTATCTDTH